MQPPTEGETWVALLPDQLPVQAASDWAVRPDCGAVVTFSGTARDHAEGRTGVTMLEYEAYDEVIEPKLEAIAQDARSRWPELGRIAMLHRVGPVQIGESAVVVAVSSPHREEAFAAARFCIDTLKATLPIWKREHWEGGSAWSLACQHLEGSHAAHGPGVGEGT